MIQSDLLVSLVVALVAAFAGGFLAASLRLPPILGYLLAGVAIGPGTPGFDADPEIAAELAEIGIILLMFGVGIHFSLRDLLAVRGVAIPGAIGQIAVATTLATGAGIAWGWPFGEALVIGLAISVASTVVLLRALEARGVLDTVQGHTAVGWLIVEDIFTVLVLVMLPALAGPLGGDASNGDDAWLDLGEALAKGIAFLLAMLIVGARVIPWLLVQVARIGSRELFTLAVLAVALGVAAGSAEFFGVSLALGAFLAGVIISESDLSHQAAAEALPMRDAFAVLFFVAVGMLLEPSALDGFVLEIAVLVAVIVLAKGLAAYAIVAVLGQPSRVGLTVAAGLAQIGEFSFILMTLATDLDIVPEDRINIVLAAALISIMLNPLVFAFVDRVEHWLRSLPLPESSRAREALAVDAAVSSTDLRGHAIVCGYGRVGSVVANTLRRRGFRPVVIEHNRRLVEDLRERGEIVIYGDAAHPSILELAHLDTARLLVVTVSDPVAARRIVAHAKDANPRLDVVVRTHSASERNFLAQQGVGEAVYGEWEIALELSRRALHRFGVSSQEAHLIIQGLRARGPGGASGE